MVNFFNQFFIKRIYKGPSTHFIKPKVLNIRYTGNQLPNYIFLNLEDVFQATPDLKKNEDNTFSLNLNIIKNDNTETVINLGLFKQEKLAKEAYVKTINAFFSPAYSLIKTFLTVAIIGVALQVTTSYIMAVFQSVSARNTELAIKAQEEVEKEKQKERQRDLQRRKEEILMQQSLLKNMEQPPFARPAPNMQQSPVPANIQEIPDLMQERIKNKEKFNEIHNDLDLEIEQIRAGKKSNTTESPADILLKELKGQ